MKAGVVLPPLSQRPALYGSVLNGSTENFFTRQESEQAQAVFKQLFKPYAKNH